MIGPLHMSLQISVTHTHEITPADLLCGRKIVCVPYHMTPQYNQCDPDFGETEVQSIARKQATLLQHFWTRWKRKYLTGLRDFHQSRNSQTVKPGAVVLVHDRINWCLAVVEDTIANIMTSTGRTNRLITKLYPLEVTAEDLLFKQHQEKSNLSDNGVQTLPEVERRSARKAAIQGRQQVREWTQTLCAPPPPPEDVEN